MNKHLKNHGPENRGQPTSQVETAPERKHDQRNWDGGAGACRCEAAGRKKSKGEDAGVAQRTDTSATSVTTITEFGRKLALHAHYIANRRGSPFGAHFGINRACTRRQRPADAWPHRHKRAERGRGREAVPSIELMLRLRQEVRFSAHSQASAVACPLLSSRIASRLVHPCTQPFGHDGSSLGGGATSPNDHWHSWVAKLGVTRSGSPSSPKSSCAGILQAAGRPESTRTHAHAHTRTRTSTHTSTRTSSTQLTNTRESAWRSAKRLGCNGGAMVGYCGRGWAVEVV